MRPGEEHTCGRLNYSMYGTRDAATNWQKEVAKVMTQWGFIRGKYNPCLYWHKEWNLQTLVHGDDFVTVGNRLEVKRFQAKLAERFEIKTTVIGDAVHEHKEGRVLNRVIRITSRGWEYEPDQRHSEMIIEEADMNGAKGVLTPS